MGRAVRVLWPDDEAWYLGTVSHYSEASGEHTVRVRARPAARRASAEAGLVRAAAAACWRLYCINRPAHACHLPRTPLNL